MSKLIFKLTPVLLLASNIGCFTPSHLHADDYNNHSYIRQNTSTINLENNDKNNISNMLNNNLSAINSNNNNSQYSEYYQLYQVNRMMSCMYPNFINGAKIMYLKNSKEEITYVINMESVNGTCKWQEDKLLFKKNTPYSIIDKVTNQTTLKLRQNLSVQIRFSIKKLNSVDDLGISEIKIPFFIVLNEKNTDNILSKDTYYINMTLPSKGTQYYISNKIDIDLNFPTSEYLNRELLSGFYSLNYN